MRYNSKILFTILLILLGALCIPVNGIAQDPEEVFIEGIEKYSNEDYQAAIGSWEKLIASGYSSADIYYNLGNAHFKNGFIPGAILNYEKALLLKPFNEDIRYNLEIARSYVPDRFESVPELFISRWFKMTSLITSSNNWAIISLALFVLSLTLLLIYFLSGRFSVKKRSFVTAIISILLSISSLTLSYQNSAIRIKKRDAIVFSPAVTGKSSPDESGKDLFLIHEGTKVKIEDELGGWYEIRLSDGNVGWIPAKTVVKV